MAAHDSLDRRSYRWLWHFIRRAALVATASMSDYQLMNAQFEQGRLNIDRIRQEMRWEPYKALAVILAGVAAMCGVILGVAHLIH